LTFVSDAAGTFGTTTAAAWRRILYSCKLDGSTVRRLTYNVSSDFDPFLMQDGRLLFSSWQRSTLEHGSRGRVRLFGINLDGTDYALFADPTGPAIQHMAVHFAVRMGGLCGGGSGALGWGGAVGRGQLPSPVAYFSDADGTG
jgi:hypothetical protein